MILISERARVRINFLFNDRRTRHRSSYLVCGLCIARRVADPKFQHEIRTHAVGYGVAKSATATKI